ncbi:hypothetical protein ACHWQZ_G018343 [Mnemiopsis leidyi]
MAKTETRHSEGALQQALDAVEVLQMTLEDTVYNHRKRDLLSTLQEVEMCYRFVEDVFWPNKSGVIKTVLSNLTKIQVNLFSLTNTSKNIKKLDCIQWTSLMTAMISAEVFEDSQPLPLRLRERDELSLKLIIADRISKFLICGPLEFRVEATQQLLERTEMSQRYLNEDDVDLESLKVTCRDIGHLVSLVDSYEVMEFWETIRFESWFLKAAKISTSSSFEPIKNRRVYEKAEIFREKLRFEDCWREIFKTTNHDFVPPKMIECYPDHPYSTYFKNNQNRFACYRNCNINNRSDCENQKEYTETNLALASRENTQSIEFVIESETSGTTTPDVTLAISSDVGSHHSSCYSTPPYCTETDLHFSPDRAGETSTNRALNSANLTMSLRKRNTRLRKRQRRCSEWRKRFNRGENSGGILRRKQDKKKQSRRKQNRIVESRGGYIVGESRGGYIVGESESLLDGARLQWCTAWWNRLVRRH